MSGRLIVRILAVLVGVWLVSACAAATPATDTSGWPRVVEVIDGDTVVLDSGETVRLIGINTPERGQPLYEEARDALVALVLNQPVRLEDDVDTYDQYGRRLAYLFLPDGTFVNLEMVRQGFAQVYTVPPNVAYEAQLRAAEQEAREHRRGLWQPSDEHITVRIVNVQADAPGNDNQNVNGEWVELENNGAHPINLEGFRLSDESNNEYIFPAYTLDPGEHVRIYSGQGTWQEGALYWGSRDPIWNNSGDVAYLRTPTGELVDIFVYQP